MLNCCGSDINPPQRRAVPFLPSVRGLGVRADVTCGPLQQKARGFIFVLASPV